MRARMWFKSAARGLTCLAALLGAVAASAQSHPHPLFGPPPPPVAAKPGAATARSVPPPAPSQARLTPAVKANEQSAGPGAVRWNAGEVQAWRTGTVDHTFTLKNDTPRPVTVSHLRGSCGCETLILAKNGTTMPRTTLAPGESAQVRVSVALRPGQDGEMHKFAWAYGPDPSGQPLATLEIALSVRSAVVFAPNPLDFGLLTVGDAKSLDVTETADADALAGRPLPTPQGASGVTVTPDGPETPAAREGHPARARRFRVTLAAPAEAGPVAARLTMPADAPPALASAGVSLAGTVSGNLVAQPRTLFFGAVPAGQGVTREASLSVGAGERGRALSASSASPWLAARVRTQAGANPVLEVSLKPGAPVGVVQTEVVVTSASGERLSVPVVGEVLSASH